MEGVEVLGGQRKGEEEQEEEKEEEKGEEEVPCVEPCGRSFHRFCLPPQAGRVRDEDGEWCCPDCVDRAATLVTVVEDASALPGQEAAISPAGKGLEGGGGEGGGREREGIDPTLPAIGWRMQRGRFLETGWVEEGLTREEDRVAARRALDGDVLPPSLPPSLPPFLPPSLGASTGPSSRPPSVPPSTVSSLLAPEPMDSIADYEAAIRLAVAGGDEARAFRLAMAMMVKRVAEETVGTRRSMILPGDVERAARGMRGLGRGRGEGER
jgi:hypothetical protein